MTTPGCAGFDMRRQNGGREDESSTPHTVGTEPLWKYGADAQTP